MSTRSLSRSVAALVFGLVFAAGAASAQDFQKTYTLEPGGSIIIKNVSGDVNIAAYEGSAVQVAAFKEGRDLDMVEVEDQSEPGRVSLRASYAPNCRCDASIRFEVRVPRNQQYNFEKISSASGNLSAKGISGRIKLNSASGDIVVDDAAGRVDASSASGNVRLSGINGSVSASTASGDVDVAIMSLEGADDLKFSSASGRVNVRLPQSLDARVHLSTASGSVETDFPLAVEKSRYSSGMSASGTLGAGTRNLRISSASGSVSLRSL